jgi:16S rRNA (cytosine1402-N4)-methyltransferase
MQFDQGDRGFSFSKEGPLDMRMDPTQSLTAAEIVNQYSEDEIASILREYGEEPFWRRVTKAIVSARQKNKFSNTKQLAQVIEEVRPRIGRGIHPATLVFQALRIAVNDELGRIGKALSDAISMLKSGGRIAVISFHSLEDRIVKNVFKQASSPVRDERGNKIEEGVLKLVTKKPLIPSLKETRMNPRARSAKLRIAEKK